jgi:hypothetical protein
VKWEDFKASVKSGVALEPSTPLLSALWHAARGDSARAHAIAQDVEGPDGAWVHAHLHREEGDLPNARYWYRHADRPESHASIEDERRAIVLELLER